MLMLCVFASVTRLNQLKAETNWTIRRSRIRSKGSKVPEVNLCSKNSTIWR